MPDAYLLTTLLLIVSVLVGLIRILLLPLLIEKLLALQLLSTASVAVAVLLAFALGKEGLTDVALLIALLTSILAIAFVRYSGMVAGRGDGEES